MKESEDEKLEVVTPVLEPMELDEIRKTVDRYYPEVGSVDRKLCDGMRPYSSSCLFASDAGELFLKKRCIGWRSKEDILWKHSVIEHLRSKNFPTPAVLKTRSGETLVETGGFYYELFDRASGVDVYHDSHSWMPFSNDKHAFQAGKMLAGFHLALKDFNLSGRDPLGEISHKPMSGRFDLALQQSIDSSVSQRIGDSAELSAFFRDINWKSELLPLLNNFQVEIYKYKDVLEPWVTHGDWHANNLFYDGDAVVSVIDFHLTDLSFRMYDLAAALDRNGILWLDILDGKTDSVCFDQISRMIQGYNSVFPMTADELKLLSVLVPMHQLDLALSNIEYYLRFEKNISRAQWAWNIYLIEHLRFFKTESGLRLIKFIENMPSSLQA